jgi:methylthioribose-1-phosphate isomerase
MFEIAIILIGTSIAVIPVAMACFKREERESVIANEIKDFEDKSEQFKEAYEQTQHDPDVELAKKEAKETALKLYYKIEHLDKLLEKYHGKVEPEPYQICAAANHYFWKWMAQNGKFGLEGNLQEVPKVLTICEANFKTTVMLNRALSKTEGDAAQIMAYLIFSGRLQQEETISEFKRFCNNILTMKV